MGKITKAPRYFDPPEEDSATESGKNVRAIAKDKERIVDKLITKKKIGALETSKWVKKVTTTAALGESQDKNAGVKIKTVVMSTKPRKRRRKLNKKLADATPDEYPDAPTVPKKTLKKYSRGSGLNLNTSDHHIQSKIRKEKIIRHDEKIKLGLSHAARTELLLLEQPGGIEVDDGESTLQLRQRDIAKQVDLASASKSFSLNLEQFGPYKLDYTLNGRHLVLGGRKGHVAAFDWPSKKLHCEFNVKESVHDVKWLHNEMLFAVAQKQWVHVYDNQGIEIHCLKKLDRVMTLDFLPYHFLLVGGHESGFLSWVDVSIGKIVAQYGTRCGSLGVLTTNPANAVTHCGHTNGTVTLWAPSVKKSLASVLCHGSPVSALAVDSVGRLMASSGMDGTLRIWDLRNTFAPLTSVKMSVASSLSFSQRGLLSLATGDRTLIFSEIGQKQMPYLRHISSGVVTSTQFCPFEDILGIGTRRGFDSIIVPGSGEANFDATERNPFQTKSQRKEAEVKALLEKIQPELISMDNSLLGEVDTEALEADLEKKPKFVRKADITLSHKIRRKSAKVPVVKQNLQAELNLRAIREMNQEAKKQSLPAGKRAVKISNDPLDRFVRKK